MSDANSQDGVSQVNRTVIDVRRFDSSVPLKMSFERRRCLFLELKVRSNMISRRSVQTLSGLRSHILTPRPWRPENIPTPTINGAAPFQN